MKKGSDPALPSVFFEAIAVVRREGGLLVGMPGSWGCPWGSSFGVLGSTELLPLWRKKVCVPGNVYDGEWGLDLGLVLQSVCFSKT